jgi:hypothetical protein
MQKFEIERINKEYFLAECEKLDAFSEDLKERKYRENLRILIKEIKGKKANFQSKY